jgi:hypothetical protein
MANSKWSDDQFLNQMRQMGDPLADACIARLAADADRSNFTHAFRYLNANDAPVPSGLPQPLQDFFRDTGELPGGLTAFDLRRVQRGEGVFMRNAFVSALVLLAKSLPEGYQAPCLAQSLCFTENLSQKPYKRLLGVLQMLINVSTQGSMSQLGKTIVTAQKMRLLHAGIRHLVREHMPNAKEYQARYGVPVNLEDMLGTIMGFSLLVVDGLKTLKVPLKDEDAEDYYYMWRVFAQLVGIHPPGRPDSIDFLPATLTEAREFYAAYRRRHFKAAPDNPQGLLLTEANLDMLNRMLPQTPLRRLGMKIVPRIYMFDLMGPDGFSRSGLKPVRFLYLTKFCLKCLPWIWMKLWKDGDRLLKTSSVHENLARIFFQRLIVEGRGGEVTFLIPLDMRDLRDLA